MSEENVDLAREAYEAYARGGPEAILPFLDPEVEWHDIGDQPDSTVHRGHEGFLYSQDVFTEPFAEFTVSVEHIEDLGGDYVLVLVSLRGRGRGSGADFTQKLAHLIKVRGGKAVQFPFVDRADALEAAGLRE
jgi:ketosteroid isomerase-like protein